MDKEDETILGQLVVGLMLGDGKHPPDNTVVTIAAKPGKKDSPPSTTSHAVFLMCTNSILVAALVFDAQHRDYCYGVLEPDGSAEMAAMILASQISARGFITSSPCHSKLSRFTRYVSMTLFGYRDHAELQSKLIMYFIVSFHLFVIVCGLFQLLQGCKFHAACGEYVRKQ